MAGTTQRRGEVDTSLSYSSATLLKNCETKYCHHKVWDTAGDSDFEDNYEAFNIGKAFHYVLENNGHTKDNLNTLLGQACEAYKVQHQKAHINAMILKYLQVHRQVGLKAVKCELEIREPKVFLGFIDVILTDEAGGWWIGDLKTAKYFTDITLKGLHLDTQLNTYAYFYQDVAECEGLDPTKFLGARYRVTTKPQIKRKKSESYNDFVRRCAEGIRSLDIEIPLHTMAPGQAWAEHMDLYKRSLELRKGAEPTKNMTYCGQYFKPCKFWSQCHDHLFTGDNGVIVHEKRTRH